VCGTLEDLSGDFTDNEECSSGNFEYYSICKVTASACFSHQTGYCSFDGELLTKECQDALPCQACFSNSRCSDYGPSEQLDGGVADRLVLGPFSFILLLNLIMLVSVII